MAQTDPALPSLLKMAAFNPVFLPSGGPKRGFLPATEARSEAFLIRYEQSVLFYDVFWDAKRRDILFVGPPPIDLQEHYRAMRIVALPSGVALRPRLYRSGLVHLHAVRPPPGTEGLEVVFADNAQRIGIAENASDFFSDENLVFSLSQDNDLGWIEDWASFHVANQGATAILLFDNRSKRYDVHAIEEALKRVPGLKRVGVVSTPFNYPIEDPAYKANLFWAHFLQPAVMVTMLRRYGMKARAILNCDIDELAIPIAGETVFDSATRSRSGSIYLRSLWVEAVPDQPRADGYRHRDFTQIGAGQDLKRADLAKWALAPDRNWIRRLSAMPYPHAIENRPMFTRHKPGTSYVGHFKAISTNWKYDRSVDPEADRNLEPAPGLADAYQRVGWK